MTAVWSSGAVLIGSAAVAAGLDQASKALVLRRLPAGRRHDVVRRWGLRRVHNHHGGRPGLARGWAVAVWVAAVVGVALLWAFSPGLPGVPAAVGLGLALGGATGNLADRLLRGAVVDFIALGRWPAFNVADAALVAGAILAPWSLR